MGFLYPTAFVFFALIPALVLAYLVRERPVRVTVSSVLAFRALRGMKGERAWGRPRFDWLFLIELIILSLAVLAMAGPYVLKNRRLVAIVLDNSAAMHAHMPSGTMRFDAARSRLAAMISGERGEKIAVYATAPEPHVVAVDLDGAAAA